MINKEPIKVVLLSWLVVDQLQKARSKEEEPILLTKSLLRIIVPRLEKEMLIILAAQSCQVQYSIKYNRLRLIQGATRNRKSI
jgi:hypothetical protein